MRHFEAVNCEPSRISLSLGSDVLCAHDRAHAGRHVNRRVVGLPDSGAILRRDPSTRQDRFALGEEKRQSLARGLLGREPLNGGCTGSGLIVDHDRIGTGPERDSQRRAKNLLRRPDRVAERGTARICDSCDGEIAGVEDDAVCRRRPLNCQPRCADHSMRREIRSQVERDVGYSGSSRTRERMRVARQRNGGHGRL